MSPLWRSISAMAFGALCACTSKADDKPVLPPPEIVQQTGKPMRTTHGFVHPTDPPGTWRAGRPHHRAIEPCSDWQPGGPLTDDYGKTTSGPKSIHMSWGVRRRLGQETVTASMLEQAFGPPHPGTRRLMVGRAAPLGPHWTWVLKDQPPPAQPTVIAEAQPDGSVEYHFADIGKIAGGGNSAGLFVECLIERYGTPGWSFDPPPRRR